VSTLPWADDESRGLNHVLGLVLWGVCLQVMKAKEPVLHE
jgi:hypothetical protein